MKFEIKNRWTGVVQYSCELDAEVAGMSYGVRLGFAVRKAIAERADLRAADLRAANLSAADLRAANLRAANLRAADLRDADLRDADLRDADLRAADLRAANLSAANLSAANLRDADLRAAHLRAANLRAADLRDANLSAADLRDADLRAAHLRSVRADFYDVLSWAPAEVPALIDALKTGRVDGSTYTGECACLVGTIANTRGVDYISLEHDAARPIEAFFAAIREGDTPETNQASAVALGWAESWLAIMQAAFAPKAAA